MMLIWIKTSRKNMEYSPHPVGERHSDQPLGAVPAAHLADDPFRQHGDSGSERMVGLSQPAPSLPFGITARKTVNIVLMHHPAGQRTSSKMSSNLKRAR